MDIDEIYQRKIGGFGPFQVKVFWAVALLHVILPFQSLHLVYIGATPEVNIANYFTVEPVICGHPLVPVI